MVQVGESGYGMNRVAPAFGVAFEGCKAVCEPGHILNLSRVDQQGGNRYARHCHPFWQLRCVGHRFGCLSRNGSCAGHGIALVQPNGHEIVTADVSDKRAILARRDADYGPT